ncbi:MAG: hypothetical protein V1799_07640 [bacterium]
MIEAQLARSFKEGKDDWMWDSPEIVADEKLNGHRILIVGDRQFSRNGKEKDVSFLKGRFPAGMKLDGEIIVRRDLDLLQGHSEVNHWLANDPEKLEAVIFDMLAYNDSSDFTRFPLKSRLLSLDEMFMEDLGLLDCRIYPSVRRYVNKKAFYDDIVEKGGEGAMLKRLERPYEPGSRSAWVKVKAWDPVDIVITDCDSKPSEWRVRPGGVDSQTGLVLPDGDHTESWKLGYVGLSYGLYDQNGKLRVVGSTGITGPKAEMEKHIGRVASFKTFGPQYDSGALQHPVFLDWRDDKDPEECVFNFGEE